MASLPIDQPHFSGVEARSRAERVSHAGLLFSCKQKTENFLNSKGYATGLAATTNQTSTRLSLLRILPPTCRIKTATTRTLHLMTSKSAPNNMLLSRSTLKEKELSNSTETSNDGSLWSNMRRNIKNAKISGGKNIKLVDSQTAVTVTIFSTRATKTTSEARL